MAKSWDDVSYPGYQQQSHVFRPFSSSSFDVPSSLVVTLGGGFVGRVGALPALL